MLVLLRDIRDKLTIAENSRSTANNVDIANAIRSGFQTLKPNSRRSRSIARNYYAQDNRYNITRRDRKAANSSRQYERNRDGRPYCTYSRRLEHPVYSCYHRVSPHQFTSRRAASNSSGSLASPVDRCPDSHHNQRSGQWPQKSPNNQLFSTARRCAPRQRSASGDRDQNLMKTHVFDDGERYIGVINGTHPNMFDSNKVHSLFHYSVKFMPELLPHVSVPVATHGPQTGSLSERVCFTSEHRTQ